MRTVDVTLERGLAIGDDRFTDAVVRETTVADVLDATEESERAVPTPDGYQMVVSPTRLGIHLLRRQIVRIGEIEGPLTLSTLRKLSTADMEALQRAAYLLDSASLEVTQKRGRDASAQADAGG